MKLTTVLLIATLLQVSATGLAQKITYVQKDATIKQVFDQIYKQTGYSILWTAQNLQVDKKINANFHNTSLEDVMKQCLDNLELEYAIEDKSVVISKKQPTILERIMAVVSAITVHGKIADENGNPLPGVTIMVKGTNNATVADSKGEFTLIGVDDKAELTITSIGYKPITLRAATEMGIIKLEVVVSPLDQVQVIGYGTTSKRFNTGNVSTISTAEIENQPVTDVLSALSGRMPGVFVQTSNGLPGGGINIEIRGQNSLRNTVGNNGNLPLYVIDGVPFSSGPLALLSSPGFTTPSVNGTTNPFNSLNPDDIESINILKDADATAIYGSRGANGVVLITTKKGKSGKTKVNINYTQGISMVANYPQLLNLQQYLQIRKEAYANDGITPSSDPNSANYAPDLTVYSQTQSTNWAKYIMGLTASTTDLQSSVSGGTEQTQFLISANYRDEGSVLLGDGNYRRAGVHVNLSHTSLNKKFSIQFSSSFTGDDNVLPNPNGTLTSDILLPPNYPLYNQSGSLNWDANSNPLADVKAQSKAQTDNFITNIIIGYTILPGLTIKTSVGYNTLYINQVLTNPLSSQDPSYGVSSAIYSNGNNQSVIVEPQIAYSKSFKKSTINILLGGTYQNSLTGSEYISASNFSNDALIENAASASTISVQNNATNYKYESVFARVTYNWDEKYIINGSIRRDGSSRFGPGDQFGNFGSIGGAWIFSNESIVKDKLPFLSFGKLRGSYGITGNDQIKDYQYLSTYSTSSYQYQGVSGLQSNQIANADLHWETNKKAELGLELGFLKDRISLSIDYFQNRSSDQLIAYTLPYLTGFANYQANLPAVVQNTGWEFELNTTNISGKNFTWKTTFNLTIPKNELLSFPGLATSSYANSLVIGRDISLAYGYKLTGVDPASGLAEYATLPGKTSPNFYNILGQTSPYFYGGFGNTFTFKNWGLDFFGQFVKQYAKGGTFYNPGFNMLNQFTNVLGLWQKPGDITNIPKASTNPDFNYSSSSANWFNTSYFRLKNISLSYTFQGTWLRVKGIDRLRIYLEGQNVLTFWKKNDAIYDPETGASSTTPLIPPMKSFVAGFQITL